MASSVRMCLFSLILAVSLSAVTSVKKIRCYTCGSTSTDLTCVNDPTAVLTGSPITDCLYADCCTIVRQENLETPGEVVSFLRSCQPNCPKDGFYPHEDSTSIFYLTYCSDPECNVGLGDEEIGGGGGGGGEGDAIYGIIGKDGVNGNMASFFSSFVLPLVILVLMKFQ